MSKEIPLNERSSSIVLAALLDYSVKETNIVEMLTKENEELKAKIAELESIPVPAPRSKEDE